MEAKFPAGTFRQGAPSGAFTLLRELRGRIKVSEILYNKSNRKVVDKYEDLYP